MMKSPTSNTSLHETNRSQGMTISPMDFVWLTDESSNELKGPYQVKYVLPTAICLLQPDEHWVTEAEIAKHYPQDRWSKCVSEQWLVTAALNCYPVAGRSLAQFTPKELRLLTPEQKSIVRWYLMQRSDIQTVTYRMKEGKESVDIWFNFEVKKPITSESEIVQPEETCFL